MRIHSIITNLLLSFLAIGLFSCNRVKEVILPHTYEIFPYEEGNYRIMQVIDTTFNTSGPVLEKYYKKEEIGGFEEVLTGRQNRKLFISRSPYNLGLNFEFEISRLYTIFIDTVRTGEYYAERIEENQRYQILKFPVYPDISWNGNLYNNLGVQEYYYQNVDTTVTVQDVTFDNCVVVVLEKSEGRIRQVFSYEVYAPGVGLIKKHNRTIVSDGPMGEFNPDKSRDYLEELIEHN